MPRFSPALIGALALAAGVVSSASADFNGEVLVAPTPPSWTGGNEETTDSGVQRTWQRPDPAETGVVETVTVTRFTANTETTAAAIAAKFGRAALGTCAKPVVADAVPEPADIGVAASVTATCTDRDGVGAFTVAHAYIGDFNSYAVVRAWLGNPSDPSSPANSPRSAEDWQTYFSRISVCNTLTDACDPAAAVVVHAHPRFLTMRELHISEAPVLPQADLMRGAKALGALTGRAADCGEDVSPLVSKIDRMFAHVTANDRDAFDLVAVFKTAKTQGQQSQTTAPRDSCGEILRRFRLHPSRVGAFPRYIEEFF